MDWIRKRYSVPAWHGVRVRYTGGQKPVEGRIRSARGGYLYIQLDGRSGVMPFHPTWEITYLTKKKAAR